MIILLSIVRICVSVIMRIRVSVFLRICVSVFLRIRLSVFLRIRLSAILRHFQNPPQNPCLKAPTFLKGGGTNPHFCDLFSPQKVVRQNCGSIGLSAQKKILVSLPAAPTYTETNLTPKRTKMAKFRFHFLADTWQWFLKRTYVLKMEERMAKFSCF